VLPKKKSGVGKKPGKMQKGVFKPLERVCFLDEIRGQLMPKNAKFETFLFADSSYARYLQI
jgi:hypothetical protein